MTIIEQIKAEIERRVDILATVSAKQAKDGDSEMSTYYHGKAVSLEELISFLSTLESEKPMNPSEDLEVEIAIYLNRHFLNRVKYDETIDGFTTFDAWDMAKYFYDLGCRRTAEKYDEIEYNRQRAEESEKPMEQEGLEEEIIKCWQEWISPSNKQSVEGVLPLSEFAFYARHFAKWGAEHLKK